MVKKLRVRTLMAIQDDNVRETMLKSSLKYFWDVFWLLWNNCSSKNSFLVVCKILRLFDNIWTSDDKYSLLGKVNL